MTPSSPKSSPNRRPGSFLALALALTDAAFPERDGDVQSAAAEIVREVRECLGTAWFPTELELRSGLGRGKDLSDGELGGFGLKQADLSEADLDGADLRECDLRAARLYKAELRDADLSDADLRCADLSGANLRDAHLRNADLCSADLRGADLRGADLRGADLCDADFRGADLRGADLRGTLIIGADFREVSEEPTPLDRLPGTTPSRQELIG